MRSYPPLLHARGLPQLGRSRLHDPLCIANGPTTTAIIEGAQQSLLELQKDAITKAAVAAGGRATFFQLTFAFVSGGLFVASIFAAIALAYALGATNIAKFKAQLKFAWRRTLEAFKTMLSAASMAMFRRRLPGVPCPPFLQDVEGCPVDEETGLPLRASRLREAWMILRTGFSRTVRTASEGIEALSLQKQLYSAAVGTPGLVTAQLLVDKLMPLRLANELEKAFEDSLKDIRIGT